MSLSKNIQINCKRCIVVSRGASIRQISSGGSNAVDPQKMQAKSVVLSQWKLVNQLKQYLAKISQDRTFENALNKEFAHFLQRIQPSVYGSDLVRYFESLTVPTSPKIALAPQAKAKHSDTASNEESEKRQAPTGLINGFKLKLRSGEIKKIVPKWKEARMAVPTMSVASKTSDILHDLVLAQSDDAKLTGMEQLNVHVNKYPEARHAAVKEGAIRLLLKLQLDTQSAEIKETSNEALALLGYAHPVPGRGIRILSIDGGGVRGILVIEMLKKLEEFTGKPIHESFDMICGVSTGAIIASLIGGKRLPLDEIFEIYKNLSTQIFTQSAFKGTSSLVWSHSYYDTALWEKMLKSQIGDRTLISTARDSKCPKICAISAVVNQSRLSAYVFRNYTMPCRVQSQFLGNHSHKFWEAVRASAAAPTYFEEFKLGNMLHQDGGILFNNPTAVALHEAKLLWPETPIQCVMSFGTGRTIPNPIDFNADPIMVNNSSWKHKFYAIIDSATDTEGVHTTLSDLLPGDTYFRFNPYLTEMLDIAEIDPIKLEQLKRDAVMYLRRNEDKFQEAAKVLTDQKTYTQKTKDWLLLQSKIHGLQVSN